MSRYDEFEQIRLDKIAKLRAEGIDPYPVRFDRTHTAADIRAAHDDIAAGEGSGVTVTVAGRLMLKRGQGKIAFGSLRDGSGDIQVMCQIDALGEEAMARFDSLDLGDWIGATGEVIRSKRGELSVRCSEVALLAKDIRPLPEKWAGLKDTELRYRMRYVDLAVNEDARRLARLRSDTVRALRDYMHAQDFTEVETPMLQVQPGGALAKPFVTHMNALDMDLYLRIAPELYLKRLIVGGLERVFEINRNFRNEGVSPQHNPEFTMLEAYQAFGDYFTMMDLMEGLISHVAEQVLGTTDHTYGGRALPLGAPFRRARLIDLAAEAIGGTLDLDMPLADAHALCDAKGMEYDPAWSISKLVVEIYEKLVEPHIFEPTFVMDFPRELSPLARPHRDDPRFTEHFDLVICGMEVGPAYSELNDPLEQRARFEDQMRQREAGDDEAMTIDEDFLRALEYGMPPTGGLGFGVDRFVRILADAPSIREILLFPLMRAED